MGAMRIASEARDESLNSSVKHDKKKAKKEKKEAKKEEKEAKKRKEAKKKKKEAKKEKKAERKILDSPRSRGEGGSSDKKEKKQNKRKRERGDEEEVGDDDHDGKKRARKREKKKKEWSKEKHSDDDGVSNGSKSKKRPRIDGDKNASTGTAKVGDGGGTAAIGEKGTLPFDHKYILAPMVGASELAFRLLCRKYGAQLAYTPMMASSKFASDASYREEEFQTVTEDRPLVCHFCANDPSEFAAAAKLVEGVCDAVDLNLGCPQRTAYVGHFGSYLLDEKERELVLNIVRAGSRAVNIPIFVKIRLLDKLEDTIELCRQLRDAGASLIAVHARFRASFERKGPGARDGPAMLDQVTEIKRAVPEIAIIANGNVVDYNDVEKNLVLTEADGIMSAEGLLDNPALFLPRLGKPRPGDDAAPAPAPEGGKEASKRKRKLSKSLREIGEIEVKIEENGAESLHEEQRKKLSKKPAVVAELEAILKKESGNAQRDDSGDGAQQSPASMPLQTLYDAANDELALAFEYLDLVRKHPIKIRTVVFHTRRMCKSLLIRYQLMEDCVACKTADEVRAVLTKIDAYRKDPNSFQFDREKAAREKEAVEKKRREEGKRKRYEGRMTRKAKREGRTDLEYYLRIGAEVPTAETIERLRCLSREEQLTKWKVDHSQHCLNYHLGPNGCERDRTCAFLHVDAKGLNAFDEREEVAG